MIPIWFLLRIPADRPSPTGSELLSTSTHSCWSCATDLCVVAGGRSVWPMKLTLDLEVTLAGDVTALLKDVVIDPHSESISHLVVSPGHHSSQARLIPMDDIEADSGGIRCIGELTSYPLVESTQFVRMSAPLEVEGDWQVGIEEVSVLPYYRAEFGDFEYPPFPEGSDDEVGITYHRIPKDRVEIRRESPVITSDGKTIGHVDGFVVDDDDHVTHLVLERGHLWGKQDVTVPVAAIDVLGNDQVVLSLTTDQVEALPRMRVHRFGHL